MPVYHTGLEEAVQNLAVSAPYRYLSSQNTCSPRIYIVLIQIMSELALPTSKLGRGRATNFRGIKEG